DERKFRSGACFDMLAADQLDGPRLGRVPLQEPRALEVREVGVHGRGRGKPDGLADLAHRRRIAVPVDVVDEEVPDLLLSSRQHWCLQGSLGRSNMCSTTE